MRVIDSGRGAIRPFLCAIAIGCLALSTSGCTGQPESTRAPAIRDAVQVGVLEDRKLIEASGITPATAAGLFWLNNDSGNDATLFAIDSEGHARGRMRVTGAENIDWEAIAAGPCDTGRCVYVGDVGDNRAHRANVTIWRVADPSEVLVDSARLHAYPRTDDSVRAAGDAVVPVIESAPAHSLSIRYPDGAHDVEAMWVGPDTSLWLVTKRPAKARLRLRHAQLFRVDVAAWRTPPGAVVTATLVDSLPIIPTVADNGTWITDAAYRAGSADSAGTSSARVAIRTYQDVYVFEADSLTGRPTLLRARCSLRALHERIGEGVSWLPDGRLLFAAEGRGSRLWTGRC